MKYIKKEHPKQVQNNEINKELITWQNDEKILCRCDNNKVWKPRLWHELR